MLSEPAETVNRADRPLTLDEWAALPEDELGELSRGHLVEEEVPGYVHEVVVAWLIRVLYSWVSGRGGLVGGSDAKFGIRADLGRKPDLTVYFADSVKPPRHGVIRVPPDIAVEVISPTPRDARRDRVEKMDDYAAFGVHFHWIVDPELRSLEIFELGQDGRYTRAVGATEGTLAAVPGCPGLTLNLSDLWAEADRLATEPPSGS